MDIGSLTGEIAIEDQLSSHLTTITHNVSQFADNFNNELGVIALGLGVVTAAITAVTAAVTTLAVKGSEINDVSSTFDHFAGSTKNAAAIMDEMRQGTLDTVEDFDLMKSSSKLLAAGVNLTSEQFGVLSKSAFLLQNQGLGPTKDMLDLVSQAMLTGQTRLLNRVIGTQNLRAAEEEYAHSLGTTYDGLNEAGKLEAKRYAILDALGKKVAETGQQHRDFGEQIEFVITQVRNFIDELAAQVAASPAVTGAMEAIRVALMNAFGGSSEAAIATIVGWVNRFADAAATYGPKIIDLLADIWKGVMEVWDAVQRAWDTVPDWFKNIARDAGIAAGAVYLVGTATKSLGGSEVLGTVASLATIWSGFGKAILGVAEAIRVLGVTGAIAYALAPITSYIIGLGAATAATGTLGAATVLLVSALGTITIVVGSLTAVVMAGWNAWKLWGESAERAASAARDAATDQNNLARINKVLGTNFTKLDEAVEANNKYLASQHKLMGPMISDEELAARAAKKHAESLLDTKKASEEAAKAAKKHEEDLKDVIDAMERNIIAADRLTEANLKAARDREYNNYLAELRMNADAAALRIDALAETIKKFKPTPLEEPDFGSWFQGPQEWMLGPAIAQTETWKDSLNAVGDVLQGVGDKWASFAAGVVRNMQAVNKLWESGKHAQAIGQAIGMLGQFIPASDRASVSAAKFATQGAAVGSVFGPWGTLIGAGVGALYGWMKAASIMRKTNDARDAWIEARGGLDNLHKSLVDQLGPMGDVITKQLLAAKGAIGWEAALKALDDAMKHHNEQMEEANQMVNQLADNFNAIAEGAIPTTKDQLEDLGVIALASINAALAAGYSWSQAITMNHAGLQVLIQAYKDLGLAVDNPLLKTFMLQDQILTENPKLIAAIDALASSFEILAKFGMLNADTFKSMEDSGMEMYTRLQGEVAKFGGTTKDALLPMQSFLHEAEKRAKELGIPLDENLQMLIDQSKELGIWEGTGKSANEKLLDGLNALVQKMNEFIDAIQRAGSALAHLPGLPDTGKDDTSGATNEAGGGVVYAKRGWSPSGTDIIPAMLTPGERVLSVAQNHAYERSFREDGGGLNTLLAELRGLRNDSLFLWPGAIADATIVALAKSGR